MDPPPRPLAERLSARQWVLVDIVVAVLVYAASATEIHVGDPTAPSGAGWVAARTLAVGVVCLSLPFRRRFPIAVLGVVAVAIAFVNGAAGPPDLEGGGGGLLVLAVPLAVYPVVLTSGRRRAVLEVGAAVVAIEVGALVAPGSPDWSATLPGLALAAVGWLAAENARTRRAYVDGLVERAAEREREREERARRASTDERLRIARELHDVVAHAMSIIAIRSGVARMAVQQTRTQEVSEALGIIEDTSRQALQELRSIVGVLRGADTDTTPAQREPAPGLADLEQLVAQIGEAGVPVHLRVEGQPRRLPPGVDLSAYRIVQEALTNVVRHAAPATAELVLRYHPAEITIEVTDHGRSGPLASTGGQSTNGSGHGLIGMRERVALYGGTLQAEPTSTGFHVLAGIPTGRGAT
jgi:signal transduction histidine kinase